MPYILSLDQGTTSSRAILFDQQGNNIAQAQHEFEQRFPNAGWVEHDPYDILTSQLTVAVEVLTRAGVRPRDVVALGITNQRETTIVWDRETGKPVYNAIVWQDRRTAPLCNQLREDGAEEMRPRKNRPACSTPISPEPRSLGFSTTCKALAPALRPASSPSAPSIAGSYGISPAASVTSRIRPTPPAPCSTTSSKANGIPSCCGC